MWICTGWKSSYQGTGLGIDNLSFLSSCGRDDQLRAVRGKGHMIRMDTGDFETPEHLVRNQIECHKIVQIAAGDINSLPVRRYGHVVNETIATFLLLNQRVANLFIDGHLIKALLQIRDHVERTQVAKGL